MILKDEDAKKFYDLWIPLLDFVNKKYKLIKKLYGMTSPKGLPLRSVAVISAKLWNDKKVIVQATLLPFGDVIIHDGIVSPLRVTLGKNMSEESKKIYLTVKANGTLHYSL